MKEDHDAPFLKRQAMRIRRRPKYRNPRRPQRDWLQLAGTTATAIAALAAASAAFASFEQVKITRQGANKAAVAARQVQSCSEINEAASDVESATHLFFMNRVGDAPVSLDTRREIGEAMHQHFRATSRNSLFLTNEQSLAAQNLRNTSLEMAALVFAISDNPAGVVPSDVPDVLLSNLTLAQQRFRAACETAIHLD